MIQFVVTGVNRRSTSQVQTITFKYEGDGKRVVEERKPGAEWEEVEFQVKEEEQPKMQVANVLGDAFLIGQTCKLIINNSQLFGTFKIGDIVPFAPVIDAAATPVA